MKERLFTLLKAVISLSLITYLLLKVDVNNVARAFARANLWYVLLALVLYFTAITIGCLKWQRLLRAQGIRVPIAYLLSFTFEGLFFGNFLLPLVAGDVVRGYDLARFTERAAEAAISVLVDKLIGMLAFITAGAAMSAYAIWGLGRGELRSMAFVVFAAFLAFLLGFAAMLSRRLRGLVERMFAISFLQRAAPLYHRLSLAIQSYRNNPKAVAQAFLISWCVLLTTNGVNWLVSRAVGANIPLVDIFIFNPLIAFAPVIVPSIGGLGVNQGAFDLFYSTLGRSTSSDLAITMSLTMQLIVYCSSLPGAILWLRKRRPLRDALESPAP